MRVKMLDANEERKILWNEIHRCSYINYRLLGSPQSLVPENIGCCG
jgi:hypothetical protein